MHACQIQLAIFSVSLQQVHPARMEEGVDKIDQVKTAAEKAGTPI